MLSFYKVSQKIRGDWNLKVAANHSPPTSRKVKRREN